MVIHHFTLLVVVVYCLYCETNLLSTGKVDPLAKNNKRQDSVVQVIKTALNQKSGGMVNKFLYSTWQLPMAG